MGYVDADPATEVLSVLSADLDISMTPFDLTESDYLDPESGVWAEELRALGINLRSDSCGIDLSRVRSATSCLNRRFSSRSYLSSRSSGTPRPPKDLFQRKNVD